jgi:DNA-binding beta-propeller fold protein YncE
MMRLGLLLLSSFLAPPAEDAPAPPMKVHKMTIGGEGGWDYLTVDPEARRLYLSRSNRIAVVDLETEKVVGEVSDTPGVHGVAIVRDLNRGFTSNGADATVTAFDLKTLKEVGKIKVGGNPDWIMYDPISKNVFTYNHGSKDASAVNPAEMKVAGTVKLEGVPEAAVSDGKGHIFVNLMDKAEVVEFDAKDFSIKNRFPMAGGQRPTGLALDLKNRRIYSVCGGNQKMFVLDADDGKVLATLEIGRGADGCGFDPAKGLAYSSNGGDGTLSVVAEPTPGQFKVIATIPTQASARTMTLDPTTHKIYLSAATAQPAPPAAADQPKAKRGRAMVPGSFVVLVVE